MSLLLDLLSRRGGTRSGVARCVAILADPSGASWSVGEDGRGDERGASLVEYSLLLALIAVVCVGAVSFFGSEIGESLSTAGDSISN